MKKRRKSIFLNGREGLAMYSSGQGLFLPRAKFKNIERQQGVGPFLPSWQQSIC